MDIFLMVVALVATPVRAWKTVPLTVEPAGVGGILEVRVSYANGDYTVILTDPDGTVRRQENVTPMWGVYFTYPADRPGTWTVTYGSPSSPDVLANVEFSLKPGGAREGGTDGACGLLGPEVLLLFWARRRPERRR